MVGSLIATHGSFARGVPDSIESIARKQGRVNTVSILHETSTDVFGKELTSKIVELDGGDGVIVLCDLLLASPYNQAIVSYHALRGKHEYWIVPDVNLPMILETLSGRVQDLGLDVISCMAQNARKGRTQGSFEGFTKVSDTDTIQQGEKRYEQYFIGTN